jgi:threonine/homoserine/homoserine lactone efflux protein
MSPFIDGLIAGYGIAIPVGAVAILIVSVSMQAGFRIGFMAGAGAATADFLYAVLASVAGTAVIALLEPIAQPLRISSGLVLIAIAAYAIWRGLRRESSPQKSTQTAGAFRTCAQFLGITLINPLTVVYFTALILGRDPGLKLDIAGLALFALGAGIASLSWQTMLAGLGGIARDRLPRRFRLWATVLGNLIVLGLGLRIFILAMS